MNRRTLLLATPVLASSALLLGAGPAPYGKPERTKLTIGMPVGGPSQLPMYVAAARTFADEGLDVSLLEFRGDAETSQALAGDSIDLSLASFIGLINLIGAGQPVRGYYAGFNHADFSWLAQAAINGWHDLKGKTMGVSTFGSLTDQLTRYVLHRYGLEPEKDVRIVQAGGSPSELQALKSGRLDASILASPYRYEAQDAGMRLLGTQTRDVSRQWPKHVFMAKTAFVEANPNAVAALLRAHVAAIRLARRDRAFTVRVMEDRLKFNETYANQAYEEAMPAFDERGRLPAASMATFWKIAIDNGEVTAPWRESRYLDRRYIDSFDRWAPKNA